MALLSRRSPEATSITNRRIDSTLSTALEFQSPAAAIVASPVPRAARGTILAITGMFLASIAALGLIPVDRVVTAQGRVVSRAHTLVVQPLETSIVRSIDVTEGQSVHAGDVLARLDPTFAAADVGALSSQVSALTAEVSRLRAEAEGHKFTYSAGDPDTLLQAAIFTQRQAERSSKLETYQQRLNSLQATLARSIADTEAYRSRKTIAEKVVSARKELEQRQLGSVLNSLAADDNLVEVDRGLSDATQNAESARRDFDGLKAERDAYIQNWSADVSQKLSEQTQRLADAQEQLNKAELRRQLIELRADRDATVLTVAKVSVGSVLKSGDQFITLVPADTPLEVEANIAGHDNGFVHVGAPVAIKFDTFPFAQHGLADGTVRTVSADSFTAQDEMNRRSGEVAAKPDSTEPFYRSRITLDDVKLHNVPAGFHVEPGMPVTADIKVGKRTVLAYLLGRIMVVTSEGMREP